MGYGLMELINFPCMDGELDRTRYQLKLTSMKETLDKRRRRPDYLFFGVLTLNKYEMNQMTVWIKCSQ